MPKFFATCPKGMEEMLAAELISLGAEGTRNTNAGVYFDGTMEMVYEVLLWTRLASRILQPVAHFLARDPEALLREVKKVEWTEWFDVDKTIVVDANTISSEITHDRYAAQTVKDGVVDYFRDKTGKRPSVDRDAPDVRLNLVLRRNQAVLSLDLSGEPLHQRGYRKSAGLAPMKENLAAAILIRADWPRIAAAGGTLVDPLCGSGTLLVEAAMMALDTAPGLGRDHFGLFGLKQFDLNLWMGIVEAAELRKKEASKRERPVFLGFDSDRGVLAAARSNIKLAGLPHVIQVDRRELTKWPEGSAQNLKPGLLVCNPPYAERMGDLAEVTAAYAHLGMMIRREFQGWQASVFTAKPELGHQLGLRAAKRYKLYNGPLECALLNFNLDESQPKIEDGDGKISLSSGAVMFANRLKKNLKQHKKWLNREKITCYRLYDADMPEYNVAIDIYESHVIVYEYRAPSGIPAEKAGRRLQEVMLAIPDVLGVDRKNVVLKLREKQKGTRQYREMDRSGNVIRVRESDLNFEINPRDYLDVGLFLDHRETRKLIGASAAGKHFLNLFAYTGTASVYAAEGGAASTTTVDLSETYLAWARRNMVLNGFSDRRHDYVRADVMSWVSRARGRYDLIFLDPPTFSNSKKMQTTFDIQTDHVPLIKQVIRLLKPGGELLFSNNFRRFKLDQPALEAMGLKIEDITAATIPPDYARRKNIHQCFRISR